MSTLKGALKNPNIFTHLGLENSMYSVLLI